MAAVVPTFLEHLARDRRGIPVPWINLWRMPDTPEQWTVEFDLDLRCMAATAIEPGLTDGGAVPDFKAQAPQRQRRAVLVGICQICGFPIGPQIPWLPIHPGSLQRVDVAGRGKVMVTTEPAVHHLCGLFAVDRCPALLRAHHDSAWTLHPMRDLTRYERIISRGWIEGHEQHGTDVAMWVKLALLDETAEWEARG